MSIGEPGFEPATARPPAECATRLRHSPWLLRILTDSGKLPGQHSRTQDRDSHACGGSSTVEPRPSKAMMRVQFPSAAFDAGPASSLAWLQIDLNANLTFVRPHPLYGDVEREDLTFGVGGDSCAAWLYPARGARPNADRRHGPRPVRARAATGSGPFAERFAAAGVRRARLRPPRLRRQRRRAGPLPPRAPARGLARGDRLRPLAARRRPRSRGDVRLLDGRRQRARRRRGRPARGRRDQPGPVPRHAAPGAPLRRRGSTARMLSPRRSAAGTCRRSGSRDEAALHQRARRRGRLAPRRRDRRGLALAQPRLGALAARPPLPARPPRRRGCTARGSSASARPTGSPGPGPAIAAARRAPLGELRIYPGVDHFDIYDGPEHEAVVADELAFLRRHLL